MASFKMIFERWEKENNINPLSYKKEEDENCILQKKSKKTKEISIDLHGSTRYEAIQKIDSIISSYKNASDIKISIIHGIGNHSKNGDPILKRIVSEYLASHPKIRYFRPGREREGGVGVTIAFIKP